MGRHKSRPKVKCYFGPTGRRGQERQRLPTSPRRDPPPPPPLDRRSCNQRFSQVQEATSASDDRGQVPPDRPGAAQNQLNGLLNKTQSTEGPLADESQFVVLPDRPTFFNYTPARRSLFDRFKATSASSSGPTGSRSPHESLGQSDVDFETNQAGESDAVRIPAAARRRLAQTALPSSSSAAPYPTSQVLSKEDCLRHFLSQGPPYTGSMLGVLRWAADLD